MEINGINIKGLLKTETIGLLKTTAAIGAALWFVAEPYVEEYVHEQVHIVQEEDKKLIEALRLEIKNLRSTIDDDYTTAKKGRNVIIEEIQYFYPQTRLRKE